MHVFSTVGFKIALNTSLLEALNLCVPLSFIKPFLYVSLLIYCNPHPTQKLDATAYLNDGHRYQNFIVAVSWATFNKRGRLYQIFPLYPNVLYSSFVGARCAILLAGVSLRIMGELNVVSIVNK
jgi:hypothetical protein